MVWSSRGLLLVLLSCCLARAEKRPDGTASLAGVVKGGSGATVALHLEPTTRNPVRYYDGYESAPNTDGSFSFTEIPPGDYRLTVEASVPQPPVPVGNIALQFGEGRVRQQPSSFTVTLPSNMPSGAIRLPAGEKRKGITVELTHKVSFCGHVTRDVTPVDAWGHSTGPANLVRDDTAITYYRFNPEFGILEEPTQFDTDKDGSFRVTDLDPGTYFVRSRGSWYPGNSTFGKAKPIVVGAESNTTCNIDIQEGPNYSCWDNDKRQVSQASIDVKINADPNVDKNRYSITFLERNPLGISADTGSAYPGRPVEASTPGESFHTSLCAEDYDVVLSEREHRGSNVWAWEDDPTLKVVFDTQKVSAVEHGTAQVMLTPHAMTSINGEVRLDKITREEFCPNCQSISVSILREGNGEFQKVDLSSGNHFDFRNVSPGDYQLFVTAPRFDKVFLQSIMVDGIAGQGRHFSIPEAKPVSMVVTLSGDLAQAAGHVSPDVRDWPSMRWEGEGMRPRASVSGKVLGENNAVYTVRLFPLGYNFNAPSQFTTQTAADGSFHFEDVPPGVYRLRGHDKNYVRFDYGRQGAELRGMPLLIAPDAQIKDLTLNAPHYSSVCGYITDEKGDPLSGLRLWYGQNNNQQSKEVNTGTGGYFRIDGLLAGDYFLRSPSIVGGVGYISGDGKLYEAAPIHVEDGKDIGCGANPPLELHIPASINSYSVSGTATGDLPARVGDRFVIELEHAYEVDVQAQVQQTKLDADHHFHFDKITPGRYRITVYGLYGSEPKPNGGFSGSAVFAGYYEPLKHRVASQLVTVSDQNLSDVTLTTLTLPSVTGTVHILHPPSDWKDLKPSDLTLTLVPHRRNGPLSAPLKDQGESQGEFTIGAADPGEYELGLTATDNRHAVNNVLYIQSARLNGKEVNPRFLTIPTDGEATLQVDVGSEMASVQVHLSEDKAFAMPVLPLNDRCKPGRNYSVLLFPAPLFSPNVESEQEQVLHYLIGFSRGSSCDGFWDGKIQNVAPGKYYAIAVKDINILDVGATINKTHLEPTQRRLWNELATIAKEITLQPGEKLDLNLDDKMIEAARIAARVGVHDEYENLRPQGN